MRNDPVTDITQFLREHNFSLNKLPAVILGILILIFIFTSWFTIGPEEVGVILRFGKYAKDFFIERIIANHRQIVKKNTKLSRIRYITTIYPPKLQTSS